MAAPKRLLFCPAPMKGHIVHTARLADFFLEHPDEYEVHVACTPEAEAHLPTGVVFHPHAAGLTLEMCETTFSAVSEAKTFLEGQATMFSMIEAAPIISMVSSVAELMKDLQPSCVIYEHIYNFGNTLHSVCKHMGVPGLLLVAMARAETAVDPLKLLRLLISYPRQTRKAISTLLSLPKEMEKLLGYKMLPESDVPYVLYPGPRSLVEVPPKRNEIYAGPFFELALGGDAAANPSPAAATLQDHTELNAWVTERGQAGLPFIYIAFGTLVSPTTALLGRIVEALDAGPWNVLWALPEMYHDRLPKALSSQWYISKFLPQRLLFQAKVASCFISHCGASSTVEAMANGIPMVCLPFFGDQYEWADSVTNHLKAGVKIDKARSSGADIKTAVKSVLEDPSYLASAEAAATGMVQDARSCLDFLGSASGIKASQAAVGVAVAAEAVRRCVEGEDPVTVLPDHLRGQAPKRIFACCR